MAAARSASPPQEELAGLRRLRTTCWVLAVLLTLLCGMQSCNSIEMCFMNGVTVDGFNDVDDATKDANYDRCIEEHDRAVATTRFLALSAGAMAVAAMCLTVCCAVIDNRASRERTKEVRHERT